MPTVINMVHETIIILLKKLKLLKLRNGNELVTKSLLKILISTLNITNIIKPFNSSPTNQYDLHKVICPFQNFFIFFSIIKCFYVEYLINQEISFGHHDTKRLYKIYVGEMGEWLKPAVC